jgi:hypothetical protein
MRQEFFFKDDSTIIERADMTDTQVVVNEPSDLIFRIVPQFVNPWNLVKEALVDATYTHFDGTKERVTLHLSADVPRSEFGILLRPKDPQEWQAVPRFLMNEGEPIIGKSQHYKVGEPFVGLSQAGVRVVSAELLEDPSIFSTGDLLAIKIVFGADVNDAALPVATLVLKGSRTSGSVVVPGVAPDGPVSVAVECLRRGTPPLRTLRGLAPSETTLYLTI